MPIYEFYCPDCHRVFSFLSRRVDTGTSPACPRCHKPDLARRVSPFAISRGRPEPESTEGGPEIDDARLEKAMESLAGEMDHVDENDPRGSARLMRRVFEATGLPVPGEMEQALRRMEAGEDPEKVEEEMGDVLDGDPGPGPEAHGGGGKGRSRWRRLLPPTLDSTLYEM